MQNSCIQRGTKLQRLREDNFRIWSIYWNCKGRPSTVHIMMSFQQYTYVRCDPTKPFFRQLMEKMIVVTVVNLPCSKINRFSTTSGFLNS